eukprot:1025590-Lingulodinium_polyedra.AAC.2
MHGKPRKQETAILTFWHQVLLKSVLAGRTDAAPAGRTGGVPAGRTGGARRAALRETKPGATF